MTREIVPEMIFIMYGIIQDNIIDLEVKAFPRNKNLSISKQRHHVLVKSKSWFIRAQTKSLPKKYICVYKKGCIKNDG